MLKKIIITLGIIIGILIIAGGGYAYYLYHSVKSTADKIYEPVSAASGKASQPLSEKGAKPISLLLMGVDERPNDRGRSDTLIYMTLNPKTNTMQMISIPRDTRTTISGRGTVDKINAAYAYGGTSMAVNTVENFTNTNIDYYLKINMQGLSDLVDAVGGVTVHNDIDWVDEGFYKKGFHYTKGDIHLNGAEALGYVRMRHKDPRGDFGRNERQRDVIMAVVNKSASVSSVSHYSDILNAIQKNFKTNMSFEDMKYVASNYRDTRKNVKSYEVKGQGSMIYTKAYDKKIYYLLVSDEEKQKVHDMIEEQLGKSSN